MMPKNYRLLLAVPLVLLVMSIGILASEYAQSGEWFKRSIELRGGTLVTLSTGSPVDADTVKTGLSQSLGEISVKQTRGISGYGLAIQTDAGVDEKTILDALSGMGIAVTDYSSQTIGPALGESFWSQAQLAIVFAFIMMGVVVFLLFRKTVPSVIVIVNAFADIIITLAMMQLFGIELSLAALAALLMLLGYSIDTNILLTARLLKTHETPLRDRMRSAFKTGITMTGTTIGVLVAILVVASSVVLSQIAAVLLIGLVTDVCLTWLQNAVLLNWYMQRKGIA
jgi:preprotein translocase subunit SecF